MLPGYGHRLALAHPDTQESGRKYQTQCKPTCANQDGSGSIDVSEFGQACKEIGKQFVSEEELLETMARFDQSGDGDISFSEFLDWWKEDAREAWKVQQKADANAEGQLNASVSQVLKA